MKEQAENEEQRVTITDTDGNVTEYKVKTPNYHIHPLFGSGFGDGYKKGQEDFKAALRAEIKKMIVKNGALAPDYFRGWNDAANYFKEKLDTVKPNQ